MTREEAINIISQMIKDGEGFLSDNTVEAYKIAIKALEQQSCGDVISRQAVLNALYALCDTGETLNENPWRDNPHIDAVIETIEELPSFTPQPKTGHWIYTGDYITDGMLKCSECGFEHDVSERFAYCPDCGAKMQEVEE